MIATTYDRVEIKGLFIPVSEEYTEMTLMRKNADRTASPYGKGWTIENDRVKAEPGLTGLPVRDTQPVIKVKLGVKLG